MIDFGPANLLDQEARGLLTRLDQIRPFVLHETMVLAAALPYDAQLRIERFLHAGRTRLRAKVRGYLNWLGTAGRAATPAEQQRRFVLIRLEFNDVLSQFDLFTEVVTQRSEHRTGVWLSGLDSLAADALQLGSDLDPRGVTRVPVVCYLSRGPGAAIRRARTRLPGGRPNPVAIIRVPRERMVGSGLASSLVHEVGHQAAAQLGLVESLRVEIARAGRADPEGEWATWDQWISEIVADCWSVGTLGLTATVGLLAVVSLPAFFVFRPSAGDPHPTPYLRVLISAALGEALHPGPEWALMRRTWQRLYPTEDLPAPRRAELERTEAAIPALVELLLGHQVAALGGCRLGDLWPERGPDRLLELHRRWGNNQAILARQSPALVFAVVGQAKAAGLVSAQDEGRLLAGLLRIWAVRSSLAAPEPTTSMAPSLRRAS